MAKVIDGRMIAAQVRAEVKEAMESSGLDLKIATVLVGDEDASRVYIGQKETACKKVGMSLDVVILPATATEDQVIAKVISLAGNEAITGIMVELPLPSHIDPMRVAAVIPPDLDIDGMNPLNHGRLLSGQRCLAPSTPLAVMEILDREGVGLQGTDVTVVNHSNIVGKPLALMLLGRNATLRVAHVFTRDLAAQTRDADVLVTAAGVPGLIKPDMVKEGAVVIDVAMNRAEDGKLCGDVEFDDVSRRAGAITPVPGGVGPVTVAVLLRNALLAHGLQTRS